MDPSAVLNVPNIELELKVPLIESGVDNHTSDKNTVCWK